MPDQVDPARKAAEEIAMKYLSEPGREVDDDGNICTWIVGEDAITDIATIIERHVPVVSSGLSRVLEERRKQIEAHGFDADHDDQQTSGQHQKKEDGL